MSFLNFVSSPYIKLHEFALLCFEVFDGSKIWRKYEHSFCFRSDEMILYSLSSSSNILGRLHIVIYDVILYV